MLLVIVEYFENNVQCIKFIVVFRVWNASCVISKNLIISPPLVSETKKWIACYQSDLEQPHVFYLFPSEYQKSFGTKSDSLSYDFWNRYLRNYIPIHLYVYMICMEVKGEGNNCYQLNNMKALKFIKKILGKLYIRTSFKIKLLFDSINRTVIKWTVQEKCE